MTNNTSNTAESYWEEQYRLSKFLADKGFVNGPTPIGIAMGVLPLYHEKIEVQERYIRALVARLTRQGVYLGNYPAAVESVEKIVSIDRSLESLKYNSTLATDTIHATPDYSIVCEFVYDKMGGEAPKWRKIGLVGEDEDYIRGYDLEDNLKYKNFSIEKIVGGKERIVKSEAVQP